MTGAGALDRRIRFRRAALVDDGIGQREVFADHGGLQWAAKADVSDGERFRAGQVEAGLTARFVVRWSRFTAQITPKDRLTCEGREYDILWIKEQGRRAFLEISARARADA